MRSLIMLLRRELWEHPALYVAPLVVGIFAWLTMLIGLTQGVGAGSGLKIIIDGAGALGALQRTAGVALLLSVLTPLFLLVFLAVNFYYLLDALYAERRDRTILFFKSLPTSDTATVASKALTAMLVAPLITVAVVIATQLAALLLMSVFALLGGGNPWGLIWQSLPLLQSWLLLIYAALALTVWYAPFVGWLLLVSAWARRAVFLWAISPLLLGQLELLVGQHSFLLAGIRSRAADFIRVAFDQERAATLWPNFSNGDTGGTQVPLSRIDVLSLADPIGLVSNWQLWAGLVVGLLFAAGAVYLRRHRGDS